MRASPGRATCAEGACRAGYSAAWLGERAPVARDHVRIEARARLGRALLRREIDVHDAEAFGESERPFEIVEQRPCHVAAHVAARADRVVHGAKMLAQIVDAQRVFERVAFDRRRIVERRAVLGDVHGRIAVAIPDPGERVASGPAQILPSRFRCTSHLCRTGHGAQRPRARIVPRHVARVVVDAEEIDRLADQLEIFGRPVGPCFAEDFLELRRIFAAERPDRGTGDSCTHRHAPSRRDRRRSSEAAIFRLDDSRRSRPHACLRRDTPSLPRRARASDGDWRSAPRTGCDGPARARRADSRRRSRPRAR